MVGRSISRRICSDAPRGRLLTCIPTEVADAPLPACNGVHSVMSSVADRTNDEWLRDLTASGPTNRDACETLRAILIQRLDRAFATWGLDSATIEDFAQDGLVRVLRSLDGFRGDSKFITWATIVAIRGGFTELRRARWKDRSLDELDLDRWPADPVPSDENHLDRQSLIATMRRVIEQALTPRQRVAVLAKLEDVPQITLAERLNMSTNALYKLQHDARKKLRRGILDSGFSEANVRKILDHLSEEP